MEGEAKEAFAAIPGLAQKNRMNPFVMLISDNNTKLGGRIDADSFSMTPTFNSLSTLGWNVIRVEEGNDLQKVYSAVEKALIEATANPAHPVAVVFKTVKGYGVKSTVESSSGGHGYPLSSYDDKLEAFVQEIYHNDAPEEFIRWVKEIHAAKPAPKDGAAAGVKTEKVQDGFARAVI